MLLVSLVALLVLGIGGASASANYSYPEHQSPDYCTCCDIRTRQETHQYAALVEETSETIVDVLFACFEDDVFASEEEHRNDCLCEYLARLGDADMNRINVRHSIQRIICRRFSRAIREWMLQLVNEGNHLADSLYASVPLNPNPAYPEVHEDIQMFDSFDAPRPLNPNPAYPEAHEDIQMLDSFDAPRPLNPNPIHPRIPPSSNPINPMISSLNYPTSFEELLERSLQDWNNRQTSPTITHAKLNESGAEDQEPLN